MHNLSVVAASVVGTEHRRLGKNNQDAWQIRQQDDLLVAVVCDGCGSAPFSEVGASLIARYIANWPGFAIGSLAHPVLWEQLRADLLGTFWIFLRKLDAGLKQAVNDLMLCTATVVVVTPKETVIATIGDGLLIANDSIQVVEPLAGNRPPYIAYDLVPDYFDIAAEELQFRLQVVMPTAELESFVIGTDGAVQLLELIGQPMPGKSTLITDLRQWPFEDRLMANPDGLRRRLAMINKDVTRPDWEDRRLNHDHGRLQDDTTIIMGRFERSE